MIHIAVVIIGVLITGSIIASVLVFAILYFMAVYDDCPRVRDLVMRIRGYHKEGDNVWRKKK